ncbi:PREDICTED: uncharacterized protein LOC101312560 isoform 1 [Fragaria vesca subsp. vesca]
MLLPWNKMGFSPLVWVCVALLSRFMMLWILLYVEFHYYVYWVSRVCYSMLYFSVLKSCRRQFDLANREAMDESAEWRLKYDVEAERSTKCMNELKQIKGSLEEDGNATNINLKLVMQQKENVALAEQIEALKQELETEKLKCRLQ